MLYAVGVVYMVIGLAILNDYYFMPALGSLSRRLRLSDDVAGAQCATGCTRQNRSTPLVWQIPEPCISYHTCELLL